MPMKPSSTTPFVKSDHSSILLLLAYRLKFKQAAPTVRMIHFWSDESHTVLQDCFDQVDGEMFCAASDDKIDIYMQTFTGFTRKRVGAVFVK